jgi:hypothetical protein
MDNLYAKLLSQARLDNQAKEKRQLITPEQAISERTERFVKHFFPDIDSAFRRQIEEESYRTTRGGILLTYAFEMAQYDYSDKEISFDFPDYDCFDLNLCRLIEEKFSLTYGVPTNFIVCTYDEKTTIFRIKVRLLEEECNGG